MSEDQKLGLFEGFGIELEYIIVDQKSLSVLPVCDKVIEAKSGTIQAEIEVGEIAWSNELALHIIELKTNGPSTTLHTLPELFSKNVTDINSLLQPLGGNLMPTAMHPWMDPEKEMRIWSHEYSAVYEAYNRIFDCRGHGWSNLQSTHINLPFAGDEEFEALHAAIRVLLPVMPALAASSPIYNGVASGLKDSRLHVYKENQKRVPSIVGDIIPEPFFSKSDYQKNLLEKLYRDISVLDSDNILQHEWLNSRAAIARFDRNAIEIRLLDIQECPLADISICAAIIASLKALCDGRWSDREEQKKWSSQALKEILMGVIKDGSTFQIADSRYLELFGYTGRGSCQAIELWQHLVGETMSLNSLDRMFLPPLQLILEKGCLSQRIIAELGDNFVHSDLKSTYRKLCNCLKAGEMFQ